jgi:hypothetical protein
MKKIKKHLWSLMIVIFMSVIFIGTAIYASTKFYGATKLTGNTTGCLDKIDGNTLHAGDVGIVTTSRYHHGHLYA